MLIANLFCSVQKTNQIFFYGFKVKIILWGCQKSFFIAVKTSFLISQINNTFETTLVLKNIFYLV